MMPGAVDTALDGADGATANVCDFLVRKSQRAYKHQCLTLFDRQFDERGLKF